MKKVIVGKEAPDFIDVAVAELAAAEMRVDLLYRLAKEEVAQSVIKA